MKKITVVIVDMATIFTGPDTVYRYDLPATGMIEGWAVDAVVDQLKELSQGTWPEIEVVVDAEDEIVDLLTSVLLNKGVSAYGAEALDPKPVFPAERRRRAAEAAAKEIASGGRHHLSKADSDVAVLDRPEVQDSTWVPRRTKRPKPSRGYGSSSTRGNSFGDDAPAWLQVLRSPWLLYSGVFVVVLGVVGLSLWGVDRATPKHADTADAAKTSTQLPHGTAAAPAPATPAQQAQATAAKEMIVANDKMELAAPAGSTLKMRDDGAYMITGPDEHMRIVVAIDPIHTASAQQVLEEVGSMVEVDPLLRFAPAGSGLKGKDSPDVVDYIEEPGDGSLVLWSTWVVSNQQLSVGCHTKQQSSAAERAMCKRAAQSIRLKSF